MHITVRGLVIRTVDIKETDRLITIFTEERGALTALARGARSLKSRKMAATMQFCYSNFVLYDLMRKRLEKLIEDDKVVFISEDIIAELQDDLD